LLGDHPSLLGDLIDLLIELTTVEFGFSIQVEVPVHEVIQPSNFPF
jgi:hypothetical protein